VEWGQWNENEADATYSNSSATIPLSHNVVAMEPYAESTVCVANFQVSRHPAYGRGELTGWRKYNPMEL
jgi:hypothetical protein